MSRRAPYRSWTGKRLAALREVYESTVGTTGEVATAYGLTRGNLQKMAVRHGWVNPRPTGRPAGYKPLGVIVCRVDNRAISLRTIMLQAVEGRP